MNIFNRTFYGTTLLGTALAVLGAAQDAASPSQTQRVVVAFRDPSAPHRLEVNLMTGHTNVTVKGTERSDVLVEYSGRGVRGSPPPGIHRIGGSGDMNVTGENNVVHVSSNTFGGGSGELEIQVPTQTAVTILMTVGGKILVDNIAGEVELNHVNGDITVTNASGPVVAHSTNGRIMASLNKVTAGKTMSFSTFNGSIDVTLPADAKATLKARADNGEIDTDFDVKLEPQQAQANLTAPGQSAQPAQPAPPLPPLPPAPPAPPAPPLGAEIRDQVRQAMEAARQSLRQTARSGARRSVLGDGMVVGSINGGGTEIQFTTFNGRILIHKK